MISWYIYYVATLFAVSAAASTNIQVIRHGTLYPEPDTRVAYNVTTEVPDTVYRAVSKSNELSAVKNLTRNSVHEATDLKLLSNGQTISPERLEYETPTESTYLAELYTTYSPINDDAGDVTTSAVYIGSPEGTDSGKSAQFTTRKTDGYKKHPCLRECVRGKPPMTCHYNFNIEWYYAMSKACHSCSVNKSDCYRQDCVTADGVKRPIVTVNRMLPGPAVEVCYGDTVIVDVANHLSEESTSIHWHGHHQRGSPYMDGVPFVTQCPIPPNTVFRYRYVADVPGTHFWHSHSGMQRGDGALGSLIVRTPRVLDPHSDLYDYDLSEHTMVVLDWSHRTGTPMLTAHYHSDGDNKPESIIVNGRGRYYNDTKQFGTTPVAVFNITQGSRYRFRLINAGVQNCPIELSIDNHTLLVISSDGSDLHPKLADTLVSYAGERWDFVLEATQDIGNYWIRFTGLMDCDERFTKAHQVAILHYNGATFEEPTSRVGYNIHDTRDLQINTLNAGRLQEGSLTIPELTSMENIEKDPRLKPVADHQIYISYDFYPMDNPRYHKPKLYGFWEVTNQKERVYTPQFNHISMKLPNFPLLSQHKSINNNTFCDHRSLNNCQQTFCECTNVVHIPLGDVVEIILVDKGFTYNANHPFHLHGYAFRVIGMDRLAENIEVESVKQLDVEGKLHRNLVNPPIKDTITVPDGGYTILRVHATNPGYWLFHCHLEFHVEVGMAMIFEVGEHSDLPPVPTGFPTCGDYFYPENSDTTHQRINEIDFNDHFKYNVTQDTNDESNEVNSGISVSHWWPLVSSSSIRYTYSSGLITGILLLFIVRLV